VEEASKVCVCVRVGVWMWGGGGGEMHSDAQLWWLHGKYGENMAMT